MSIKELKSMTRRGMMFGAAFAVFAATVFPATSAFADSLNPLTERSLLLSSSAPGFQNSDGSGNTEGAPNAVGTNYAPPGSGPNGQKSGQTFSFKVSSDSRSTNPNVKAFTLQYCTSAAGKCQGPGNNVGDGRSSYPASGLPSDPANSDTSAWTGTVATPRGADTSSTSDLNVNYSGAVAGTDFSVFMDTDKNSTTPMDDVSTGWVMTTSNVEDLTHSGELSGKQNYITLTHATGIEPDTGTQIKIVFKASTTDYITNPGDKAFFVKINTYNNDTSVIPGNIIDGGVTVANVMTDSIHITTKVLETMSFSVGTRNRDTVRIATAGQPGYESDDAVHGTCSPIQAVNDNRLNLGNPDAEFSLETGKAWDVYSYWRLSSNSSGGATVYYSGNTLQNTVGDRIEPIGPTAAVSTTGTEQFGLGFVDATTDDAGKFDPIFVGLVDDNTNTRFKMPSLTSDGLAPEANYDDATGTINAVGNTPASAAFAFEATSNTIPAVIAKNSTNVISCATAKMRYVANIGADTPAGVYTTKINYLAAPQY